jgi:Cu(I)/Ag(I) efflux system protein CusF
MSPRFAAILASAAFASLPVFADKDHSHSQGTPAKAAAAESGFSEGEVKKIDKAAGKVTIKHGPLASLDMPAMTMVFRVKDVAMLDQVKAGDNIRFKADKVDGAYTVTEYQAAK